jgi:hypothetical protein
MKSMMWSVWKSKWITYDPDEQGVFIHDDDRILGVAPGEDIRWLAVTPIDILIEKHRRGSHLRTFTKEFQEAQIEKTKALSKMADEQRWGGNRWEGECERIEAIIERLRAIE